ncbi:Uma2 family endonuclease [Streptomyces sp. NPDC018045]|uniref:Uma2 family endonuclease n=1 Tax=Streptomyces sp. NPDC018045 TaxID=3365037 RepID=UPI003793D7AD
MGGVPNSRVTHPLRGRLFIADLVVVPDDIPDRVEGGEDVPLTAAEPVVEITSPDNASCDRLNKAAAYAEAGVPLYLLIDRFAPPGPTVTLFGEPEDAVYQELQAVKFGEDIHLPEPFDLTIDTSVFPFGP